MKNWFTNNAEARKPRLPAKIRRDHKAIDVFRHANRDAIQARAAEEEDPISQLDAFNKACAALYEELSPEKKAEFQSQAEEWNQSGPPQAKKSE